MKKLTLVFLLIFVVSSAQRKRKMDVVSNLEVSVMAMKPVGNNSLAENLEPFYGFGFGGNLMTPINFGIGLSYTELFSNVKNGRQNIYGNLGAPRITQVDAILIHKTELSEDYFTEEFVGPSYYRLLNNYTSHQNAAYQENALGFTLGAKIFYVLSGPQLVFLAAKGNYFSSDVYNENPEIRKYYAQSFLLSLSFGYRYQF